MTIDYNAFRAEVQEFLATELTEELREAAAFCPGIFLDREYNMKWQAILHKRGWVAPAWPKEYGGPMLIGHGTQEQKNIVAKLVLDL